MERGVNVKTVNSMQLNIIIAAKSNPKKTTNSLETPKPQLISTLETSH